MKKNSVKDIAKLIAEEFNIDSDFNDFMSFCKLIDIGLERLEEIKNEFLYNELSHFKKTLEITAKNMMPVFEEYKKDKPVYDIFQKIWKMENENSAGIDIQDVALYFEKELNKNRIKKSTNKKIGIKEKTQKTYDKINKQYYQLIEHKSQKETLNILSSKFKRTPKTILQITKKK